MGAYRGVRIFPLVAQPDNAADSDSEDRGFESLRAGHEKSIDFVGAFFNDIRSFRNG